MAHVVFTAPFCLLGSQSIMSHAQFSGCFFISAPVVSKFLEQKSH